MQAVIMVGGLGVRLRPFTYTIPKPLLPIGETTILESIVTSLCDHGFNEIFLLTSYQHKKFEKCYDYGDKYGIDIHICREETKMGTVGGIFLIKDRLDDDFLVLNGDLIVQVDFGSLFNYHQNKGADVTIGTTRYEYTVPYGVIDSDKNGELLHIIEKPKQSFLISAGIYMLKSDYFRFHDPCYMDMPSLIEYTKNEGKKVLTYDIGNRWLDMGQFESYETALEKIEEWNK